MWGKRNKFNRTKVEHHGHWFDSKLEKAVYELLLLRQENGEINSLKHHPGTVFLTDARIQYRPDFKFKENGKDTFAEAKGYPTQTWAIKKKLWKHYGPGKLYIYGGTSKRVHLIEVIK